MRKASLVLGLTTFLVACGGRVDAPGSVDEAMPPSASTPSDGSPSSGTVGQAAPKGPEHVADGVGTPSALALSTDAVVFTTRETMLGGQLAAVGGLFVADKRVGPALMIAVDRQGATYDALALDDHDAFVATSDGRLVRVPLTGGAEQEIAELEGAAVALATSSTHVYFARESGEVGRVAKAGGEAELLATVEGAVRGIQADETAAYVATSATEAAPEAAGIVRVELEAHSSKRIASSGEPCALIRDGARLFWTSQTQASGLASNGVVSSLPLAGGEVTKVASGTFAACAIASDKDSLWFATTAPSALPLRSRDGAVGLGLMRAPIAGGEPSAVSEASNALAQPGAVAVDANHLYWLTQNAVLRLRK